MIAKRILAFIMILSLLIPFSSAGVFASKTEDNNGDKISEQIDREKEQGNEAIQSQPIDVDSRLKENQDIIDLEKNSGSSKPNEKMEKFSKSTYNFTWNLLVEARRNSFPICLLGIIAGSLIYFILGPRNMPRKKYGAWLMFGFLTIFLIAQIAPVFFMLMIQ